MMSSKDKFRILYIKETPQIPDIDMGGWVDKLIFSNNQLTNSCAFCGKKIPDNKELYCSVECEEKASHQVDEHMQGDYE